MDSVRRLISVCRRMQEKGNESRVINLKKTAVINITSFGREFPQHLQELEEKVGPVDKMLLPADMDGRTLAQKLKGYTYIVLGNYPTFDETFFSNNCDVKLIARHGIGFNNVDLESSKKHGVYVTHIQGASGRLEQGSSGNHGISAARKDMRCHRLRSYRHTLCTDYEIWLPEPHTGI